MRYVTVCRQAQAFGQDRLTSLCQQELGAAPLRLFGNSHPVPDDCKLLITHDPDSDEVATCLDRVTRRIAIVAHVHLQLSYLDDRQRQNLRSTLSRADVVIVPAEFLKAELSNLSPLSDCRVIPLGIDCTQFSPSSKDARVFFRKRLGAPATARILACVGRLESAKGSQILECLAAQLSSMGDTRLLVQYPGYDTSARVVAYREQAQLIKRADPLRVHLCEDLDP